MSEQDPDKPIFEPFTLKEMIEEGLKDLPPRHSARRPLEEMLKQCQEKES